MVQDTKSVGVKRKGRGPAPGENAVNWFGQRREELRPLSKMQACFDAYRAGYVAGLAYKNK